MSNNIYTNLDQVISKIDVSRLSRDFQKYPFNAKNRKPKTWFTKEDLKYLYIELNLSMIELCEYFHIHRKFLSKELKKYNIIKPISEQRKASRTTCKEKYGVEYYSQTEEFIIREKTTIKEKYGVEWITQLPEVKQKKINTCIKKYGVPYYAQTEECKDKCKTICFEKFGVEYFFQVPEIKEKISNTMLEKYGSSKYILSEDFHNKSIKTCNEKYNTDYYCQSSKFQEQRKETCLNKYGTIYPMQNPDIKEKRKETCFYKYGNYYIHTEKCLEHIKKLNLELYGVDNFSKTVLFNEKYQATCIKKYGVPYYSQTEECKIKSNFTKKKNNSFNSSKEEDKIYKILLTKFSNTKRQYRSDLYQFDCDFYIQELDLYIEYQGTWTHGKKPFNKNDNDCISLVNFWNSKINLEKSNQKKDYYSNAIYTYTDLDVRKRQTAQQNNLNWIEFFTMEDFLNWFESL